MQNLIRAARSAQKHAHAPYSEFPVGAALLTSTGKIFTGCNVENASFGLTICAERVAVTKAVSEGYRKFRAIAVVAPHKTLTPCGACRQFLAEFGDIEIICADSRRPGNPRNFRLSQLLPEAFGL